MKLGSLLLASLTLPAFGQDYGAPQKHGSIGIAGSSAGLGLSFVYTGPNRIGFFGGVGGQKKEDKDLPTEAYFNWINYANEDVKGKFYFNIGPAFRINQNITIGVGYSYYKKEFYSWGYGVSGMPFRYGGRDETKNGPFGLLDFGSQRGIGAQLFAGPAVVGGGLTFRF